MDSVFSKQDTYTFETKTDITPKNVNLELFFLKPFNRSYVNVVQKNKN
jgi:hypothetical protein